MSKKKKIIIGIVLAFVLVILFVIFRSSKSAAKFTFETDMVVRGTIANTVTATGTVQAVKTVEVGTQVSGTIRKLFVDFNTVVKKGQILAELDKTTLLASLQNAQASLDDAKSELAFQTSNFNRTKSLFDKELSSQADFDVALNSIARAQASLKNAQSNYEKARINLSYATIYSPIDGVVLDRAVDEGQTVAASFNTPTLFSIANDLSQMQVEANIDEADIGFIKQGQNVRFSVDAFPDLQFTGEVIQVRFKPIVTSNVVTYTVIVKAANPNMKLMPGMTANIEVNVQYAENALLIPYKAIRFKPNTADLYAYFNSLPSPENENLLQSTLETTDDVATENMVWVRKGNGMYKIPLEVGINNGITIEVTKGLTEGDEVVLNMTKIIGASSKSSANSSPFMPKPRVRTPRKK